MTLAPRSPRWVALALALATVSPALLAADAKKACFDAYVEAQKNRKGGKLKAARANMLACSQDACPPAVRTDCTQWLAEVSSELPSVLVAATDRSGNDTAAVRVSIDGAVVAERLDGKPIELDPGEHVFRFEHAGATQEKTMLVRQSEKSRKIAVDFSPEAPAKTAPTVAASAPIAPPPETSSAPSRPVPVGVYVLGGVGVASVAVGAYFYFAQKSLHDDLSARCAPACSPDDVSPLKTKQLLAGLGAGVGVAALAAATVLYLTRGGGDAPTTALSVAPVPGGAAFSYGGAF